MKFLVHANGCFLSPIVRSCVVAVVALLAQIVCAQGYWTTAYSGGEISVGRASFSYQYSNGSYGGGGTTGDSGQITATFTWVSQGGGPPESVYVLETCAASANGDTNSLVPVAADNGLSSGSTTTTTVLSPTYSQIKVVSSGTRISNIITGGNDSFTVTCTPSTSSDLSCGVTYSAVVTTKALTIDSSVDVSYHKGSDGTPVSNLTNVATPRFGDTWVNPNNGIYQYNQDTGNVLIGYANAPTFTCQPIGYWSTNLNHVWNANGEAFTDTLFSTYTSITPTTWMVTPTELESMATGGPQTYTVNLTLTDNGQGGTSASAMYYLRVHNEYDNCQNIGTLSDFFVDQVLTSIATPGYATQGEGIPCTWTEDDTLWSFLSAADNQLTPVLSSIFENPLYDGFFAVLGIGLQQILPQLSNGDPNFDSLWGAPASTITGSWSDPKTWYDMEPVLAIEYSRTIQQSDTWGANGYTGLTRNIMAKMGSMKNRVGWRSLIACVTQIFSPRY